MRQSSLWEHLRTVFRRSIFCYSCTVCPERELFPDTDSKAEVTQCCCVYIAAQLLGAPQSAYAGREWDKISEKCSPKYPKESPGRGWTRSRWHFKCSAWTEAKQGSVTERHLCSGIGVMISASLIVWCQLHNINFWDGCQTARLWRLSFICICCLGEVVLCRRQRETKGDKSW